MWTVGVETGGAGRGGKPLLRLKKGETATAGVTGQGEHGAHGRRCVVVVWRH